MNIKINIDGDSIRTEIGQGDSLLEAINNAGIEGFDAPCGGKGTCGKCRITIENAETLPPLDGAEKKSLSEDEIKGGVRLACRVFPESEMEITVSASGRKAAIQSEFEGAVSSAVLDDKSILCKLFVEVPTPSIDDQRSDLQRLIDSIAPKPIRLPMEQIRVLPGILRENDSKITVVSFFNEWIAVESGDTYEKSYAVAVDIGTTTVVGYLVEISGNKRGRIIEHVSGLNSQKGYGADVVSRIEYCMRNEGGLEELKGRITSQINGIIAKLAEKAGIDLKLINLITIAGNTTMTHIFSGFNPEGIAAAPFIPVVNDLTASKAADFGFELHDSCFCVVLPGIASYVGSDITSGIIATGMHESEELCLLIDVGTNGEIVLGNKYGLTACSTAAGPALEGANISCGMGGVPGAISSLMAAEVHGNEVFSYSVIEDVEPVGICGSGIVDAVAIFVKAGLIDNTGRILTEEELAEAGVHKSWIDCVVREDGKSGIKIADEIMLSQKDIREIQMAKGAIAAGVNTLLAETGKTSDDVKKLYIAGGFGAAMNKTSAAAVGLFPPELEEVVEIAGNTAGKGAVLSALSENVLTDMRKVARNVKYIELSTSVLFQNEYMMSMYFQS